MKNNFKENINNRFLECCDFIISEHDLKSDAEVARLLGIHGQVFSDIRTKKGNATLIHISNLLMKFPYIDGNWILAGLGGKLKKESIQQEAIGNNSEFITYLKEQISVKDKKIEELSGEVSALRKDVEFLSPTNSTKTHIFESPVELTSIAADKKVEYKKKQ